jgi:hypothetical protein
MSSCVRGIMVPGLAAGDRQAGGVELAEPMATMAVGRVERGRPARCPGETVEDPPHRSYR